MKKQSPAPIRYGVKAHPARVARQRQSERQPEASRTRLAHLYNFAPVVYVTLDPRCKILEANLTAAASFGIARGDLIGKSLSTLVVPADRPVLRDHVSRCVGERMVVEAEVRFAIRGRPTVTAQVVSAPFVAVDGTVTECKTTLTDITALKQGQARAIRARDDLLMFVSHDLRNLLTGVYLTTEQLLRGAHGPERRKGWNQLERVRRGTQQMQRMIDDLLDLASVEAGRLNIVLDSHDVRRICDDVLADIGPIAVEKGVSLERDVAAGALVARCDRQRVVQVLLNLLGNAVKFTPAGGMVRLTAQRQRETSAQFTILDTGPGVPAARREHIFERFWQAEETARKGRGLGLYIAKGLVEAQGGSIWVDSPRAGGASFSFTLPLAPAATATLDRGAAAAGAAAARSAGGRR